MLTLGFNVRLMSFFRGVKPSYERGHAVSAYTRAPTFAVFEFRHAKKAASFVSRMRSRLILNVFRSRYIAKIFKRVISRIAVNVVNVSCWPMPHHIKPRQSVRPVPPAIYADDCVSFRFGVTCNSARNNFSASLYEPSKYAGFRAVVQNCTQLIKRDVKMCHAISLT